MSPGGAATIAAVRLAPAVDGIRLALHVTAAAIWVGGQFTLAGLVPTARRLGEGAPAALARAFSRVQWPAYAVLIATGIWNVSAAGSHAPGPWKTVLAVKIAVALAAGAAALLHTRSRSKAGLAVWGATSAASSLAALVIGVFLAG